MNWSIGSTYFSDSHGGSNEGVRTNSNRRESEPALGRACCVVLPPPRAAARMPPGNSRRWLKLYFVNCKAQFTRLRTGVYLMPLSLQHECSACNSMTSTTITPSEFEEGCKAFISKCSLIQDALSQRVFPSGWQWHEHTVRISRGYTA